MDKLSKLKELIKKDRELRLLLDKANTVMIKRLDYNDHGRVHAKIVAQNTQKLASLLKDKLTLPKEGFTYQDSKVVLYLAAYLHDIGCSVMRDQHELFSVILGRPIAERMLKRIYGYKGIALLPMVMECVVGHMGNYEVTSTEAGILAVADACDMTKGRARIPFEIGKRDIHEYSAMAISKVEIVKGSKKPVKIRVEMENSAGVFQVELLETKIKFGKLKDYVEVEYHNLEDNYTEED